MTQVKFTDLFAEDDDCMEALESAQRKVVQVFHTKMCEVLGVETTGLVGSRLYDDLIDEMVTRTWDGVISVVSKFKLDV